MAVQYVHQGNEFQVNTLAGALDPTVAALASGGFVVTWTSLDGNSYGNIKAQIFDAAGSPLDAEFQVNSETMGAHFMPVVAPLASGGFIVSWTGFEGFQGVKAQIFDAAGAPVGNEFLVNSEITFAAGEQTIAPLASGGFVVSWVSYAPTSREVIVQIFDALGSKVGAEIHADAFTTGSEIDPTITALAGGGFVVAWTKFGDNDTQHGADTDGYGIAAQIFDAAGAKVGGAFEVNTATFNNQYEPAIAALAGGGFVVTWSDASGADSPQDLYTVYDVKGQIFDASGARVGTEFLVNTMTDGNQDAPVVTPLASGGFIVSWSDGNDQNGDPDIGGITAQIFNAAGAKVGGEFHVNTLPDAEQPSIATLASGFVDVWSSIPVDGTANGVVRAQIFVPFDASNAPPVGTPITVLPHGTEDIAYAISLSQLKAGFSDPNGDVLSIMGLTADHGLVSATDAGYLLMPSADYNGPETLTYTVTDARGGSVAATLGMVLDPVNDAPALTGPQAVLHGHDRSYHVTVGTLLTGFTDVDGDTLAVANLSVDHGTATFAGNTYTITPEANDKNPQTLSYDVVDAHGGVTAASQTVVLDPAILIDGPGSNTITADDGEIIKAALDHADDQFSAPTGRVTYAGTASNLTSSNNEVTGSDIGHDQVVANELVGGSGDDTLSGWNRIVGGAGNDILTPKLYANGGDGDDTLVANSDQRVELRGGAGNDTLVFNTAAKASGGPGDDQFIFHRVAEVTINDLSPGEHIVLSDVLAVSIPEAFADGYLNSRISNGYTYLSIDQDGGGDHFSAFIALKGQFPHVEDFLYS